MKHAVEGHDVRLDAVTNVAVVVNVKVARASIGPMKSALDAADIGAVWHLVGSPGGAARATRDAMRRGATVVVVAGGTRTITSAMNELSGSDVAIALVASSPCRFVEVWQLPTEPHLIVDAIVAGSRHRVPIVPTTAAALTEPRWRRVPPTVLVCELAVSV